MREPKKAMFYKEVRAMMYGFGDVSSPRMDTVETLHNYLMDYLSLLLIKVHDMAKIKGKTKTEDLMYFLKRDRKKYSRVKNLLLTNDELKTARKVFDCNDFEKD